MAPATALQRNARCRAAGGGRERPAWRAGACARLVVGTVGAARLAGKPPMNQDRISASPQLHGKTDRYYNLSQKYLFIHFTITSKTY